MNISPPSLPSYSNPTGSDAAPDYSQPGAVEVSHEEAMRGLNPLHYVPVVGMIYRAATGETIPATMRAAGAALVGGPLGVIGAGFMGLIEALFKMGPDNSRPSVPAGMSETGSEAGVQPVTPGTTNTGAYLTLATSTPDFLQSPPNTALAQAGAAAYQTAETEWQRSQAVERGLA